MLFSPISQGEEEKDVSVFSLSNPDAKFDVKEWGNPMVSNGSFPIDRYAIQLPESNENKFVPRYPGEKAPVQEESSTVGQRNFAEHCQRGDQDFDFNVDFKGLKGSLPSTESGTNGRSIHHNYKVSTDGELTIVTDYNCAVYSYENRNLGPGMELNREVRINPNNESIGAQWNLRFNSRSKGSE